MNEEDCKKFMECAHVVFLRFFSLTADLLFTLRLTVHTHLPKKSLLYL